MQAYSIEYKVKDRNFSILINAKDVKSAKKKIGRKHGDVTGRKTKVLKVSVIGYF